MATAGERYEQLTGNIWSYAHRGDLTGLKAAVARGVDVNIVNTVGWTACHAAAAGGQCKALRYLIRVANAQDSLRVRDRGGNLPVHHAAKNGHVGALRTLQELGADLTQVRISQTKGQATRDLVLKATNRKIKATGKQKTDVKEEDNDVDDDAACCLEDENNNAVVGYARKQSKSTAFWGPRKTPISCKIKKKIIKEKRQKKKEKKQQKVGDEEEEEAKPFEDHYYQTQEDYNAADDLGSERVPIRGANATDIFDHDEVEGMGYHETVQNIKRNQKHKRRGRQLQKQRQREEQEAMQGEEARRRGSQLLGLGVTEKIAALGPCKSGQHRVGYKEQACGDGSFSRSSTCSETMSNSDDEKEEADHVAQADLSCIMGGDGKGRFDFLALSDEDASSVCSNRGK